MIKLNFKEDYATDMKYAVVDLEHDEVLISAENIIDLFLMYQDSIYTVIDIETDESFIEEKMKSRQRRKNARRD